MKLQGKKILVIGGAGLIGSYTLEYLINEDVSEILIYDNFSRGKKSNINKALDDPRVRIYDIGGDITHFDVLSSAMKGCDAVFHFAALWLLQCHEFPRYAFKVNIEGMFNVLEACRINEVKRLVWSSSASVYGDAIVEPMTEEHPLNNKNFYGATKISGEAMATAYSYRYGLNQIGLRYMNVYGPRQDYKGVYIAVIMRMLDAINKGEELTIIGDGNEAFDFVAAKDCGRANICAMKSNVTASYYNIGTGVRTTLNELAEKLIQLTDYKKSIKYIQNDNKTLVKSRIGCTKQATEEIGFTSNIDLDTGLKDLIEWYKYNIQTSID